MRGSTLPDWDTERAEASRDALSLAAVALDRVLQRQGLEIVHVPWSHAQAPQGRRPQFVGRVLWRILYDAVTGPDVMQQEVTERMNDLVPQRLGHGERATVDDRARRRRRDGLDVAGVAAHPLEQGLARQAIRALRQRRVARWHLRAADKFSKVVDVGQPQGVRKIFGI